MIPQRLKVRIIGMQASHGDLKLRPDTLRVVISFLNMAKVAFHKLEMHEAEQDALYLLAVACENADKTTKRDLAIAEFRQAEEKQKQAAIEMDEDMMAAWEFVCEVGVMISTGLNWDGQA